MSGYELPENGRLAILPTSMVTDIVGLVEAHSQMANMIHSEVSNLILDITTAELDDQIGNMTLQIFFPSAQGITVKWVR
jgi:hypothetical protein